MSKKLLLSIAAAALFSGTMMAQVADPVIPSVVTLTPYDDMGVDLPSVNSQITVTMDAVPNVPVTVMYITGNGFAMNMNYERINVPGETFTIPLSREKWGVPYNEVYYLNLVVTFTYGEGDEIDYYINPDTKEPVVASCMYMTADTGDARLELTFPNQQNIDNGDFSLSGAYEMHSGSLYFSKEVGTTNAFGSVMLYDADGGEINFDPIIISVNSGEWSEMDGLYMVSFTFQTDEEIDVDSISEIVYSFSGFSYEGAPIIIEPFSISTISSTPKVAQPVKKSKLSSSLSLPNEGVTVFNIQGNLVYSNASNDIISSLPAGLYIIDGKKVFIK